MNPLEGPRPYTFEEIDDTLDLMPLTARRALDAAGCKVSLASWRLSPLEARRALAALGATPSVDTARVWQRLADAAIPHTALPKLPEPDPQEPPDDVPMDGEVWRALRPLDRYALVKTARGRNPSKIERAIAEVAASAAEAPALSTHLDARGHARMVDVGAKSVTGRHAVARARVSMQAATVTRLRAGDTPKGDVLATARIAGIQAAKKTSELIPLCHAIALTRVGIDLTIDDAGVLVEVSADAHDRTGVEMEAMTGASIAALTLYDMLKGIDRGMTIHLELTRKEGGKTGLWQREET